MPKNDRQHPADQLLDEALDHIHALVHVIDKAAPSLTEEQGAALAAAWRFKILERARAPFWDKTTFLLRRLYNAAARYLVYCVANEPETSVHRSTIESEFFAALLDVRLTRPQLTEKYSLKSLLEEIQDAQE